MRRVSGRLPGVLRGPGRPDGSSRQLPSVRYYALIDYLHVLKLIGSDWTTFGLDCAALLCNGYFQLRMSKVLG